MAEFSRSLRNRAVALYGRFLAFLLSSLGIITASCGTDPVAYGPPYYSFTIYGKTMSAADSTTVPGISVGAYSADSSTVFDSTESGDFGTYTLYIEAGQTSWPDTVRVVAVDTDGDQHGSFENTEVMVFPDESAGGQEINADFYMEPGTPGKED